MELDKINAYRPAMVAMQYFERKDKAGAAGALEKLVDLDFGKDGRVLADAVREQTNGNELFASAYANIYAETLHGATVKDLFGFYDEEFKSRLDEAHYAVAKDIFEGCEEKYSDVLEKLLDAERAIEDFKKGLVSNEDKKKAENVMKKYQPIIFPLQKFEALRIRKISDPVDESTLKETLVEMYKPTEAEN